MQSSSRTAKQNKSAASKAPHGNSYRSKNCLGMVMSLERLSEEGYSRKASINIAEIISRRNLKQ
jgi:hypothetical protein